MAPPTGSRGGVGERESGGMGERSRRGFDEGTIPAGGSPSPTISAPTAEAAMMSAASQSVAPASTLTICSPVSTDTGREPNRSASGMPPACLPRRAADRADRHMG